MEGNRDLSGWRDYFVPRWVRSQPVVLVVFIAVAAVVLALIVLAATRGQWVPLAILVTSVGLRAILTRGAGRF